MRIGVNGRFYAARATGVQRVAAELVLRLTDRADVTLRVPRGCPVPDAVAQRAIVVEGRLRGPAWEQLELPAGATRAGAELDPANAGPLWGGARILVLHDVLPLSHPQAYAPAFRHWFARVVAGSARRARAVIMFSEWARREAIRHLGLDPARVRVATQGLGRFDAPASHELVRRTVQRFGLTRPFILATGDGDPRKNAPFLHEVMRRLGDATGDATAAATGDAPALVLVGDAYPHVQRAGVQTGPSDVLRLGHVTDSELHALYTATRAFCFPSLAEGFGRPPLEAMACGTPAIAADYGSAREILRDAALVLPLDVAAWAAALGDLLRDGPARDRRVAAGFAHARTFRWGPAVDAVLEACEEAADSSERARRSVAW